LHDNDGSDDRHGIPFDGTVSWPVVMKAIAETGYSGATALEVIKGRTAAYKELSPEEFLRLAFERAKGLEAMKNGG